TKNPLNNCAEVINWFEKLTKANNYWGCIQFAEYLKKQLKKQTSKNTLYDKLSLLLATLKFFLETKKNSFSESSYNAVKILCVDFFNLLKEKKFELAVKFLECIPVKEIKEDDLLKGDDLFLLADSKYSPLKKHLDLEVKMWGRSLL